MTQTNTTTRPVIQLRVVGMICDGCGLTNRRTDLAERATRCPRCHGWSFSPVTRRFVDGQRIDHKLAVRPTRAGQKRPTTVTQCCVPGCIAPAYARGLCSPCYNRARRDRDPEAAKFLLPPASGGRRARAGAGARE